MGEDEEADGQEDGCKKNALSMLEKSTRPIHGLDCGTRPSRCGGDLPHSCPLNATEGRWHAAVRPSILNFSASFLRLRWADKVPARAGGEGTSHTWAGRHRRLRHGAVGPWHGPILLGPARRPSSVALWAPRHSARPNGKRRPRPPGTRRWNWRLIGSLSLVCGLPVCCLAWPGHLSAPEPGRVASVRRMHCLAHPPPHC